MIITTTQKRQFKLKNMGQFPIDIVFDPRHYRNNGFAINPEKINKFAPGEEIQISIVLTTKKNMPFGKSRAVVPFEVRGGARYKMELLANITIPEFKIEDNPEGIVEFGKVLCGKRKTVFIRLLNHKEIPCEWALTSR